MCVPACQCFYKHLSTKFQNQLKTLVKTARLHQGDKSRGQIFKTNFQDRVYMLTAACVNTVHGKVLVRLGFTSMVVKNVVEKLIDDLFPPENDLTSFEGLGICCSLHQHTLMFL